MVFSLHPLHELRLAGDVEVIDASLDAGSDDGVAIDAEGTDAVEEELGAAAEGEERGGVGDVGGDEGDGGRRRGGDGPGEGLGELGRVAAGEGEGFERGIWSAEELEGFPDNVFSSEARGAEDDEIEGLGLEVVVRHECSRGSSEKDQARARPPLYFFFFLKEVTSVISTGGAGGYGRGWDGEGEDRVLGGDSEPASC